MKTKNIVLAAALLAFAAAPGIANAASDTASADATIVAPVTVTKASDLQFGLVGSTASAGTVSISEAGARTGDANVLLLSGATPTQASFTVAGANNAAVVVTVPASASLTGPGTAMTATLSSTLNGSQTLDGSGAMTVNVAADLAVGASQASGAYATTFDVTVIYN